MSEHLCVQFVPLFQKLKQADQEEIEKLINHVVVQKGEVVYAPNDSQQLIILESGRLKVENLMENGDAHFQAIMQSGDFMGENWLFGAENNNVFLTAEELSQVCRIDAEQFRSLLIDLPQLSYELTKHMVRQINEVNRQNYYLTIYKIKDRIMAYFMDLSAEQESYTIQLTLSLKDTASYLGTTPETLSRKIQELTHQNKFDRIGINQFVLFEK
ncbi:Crp/Fnr family transcriptional regulator [Weissella koreensis]|nr:Crp/Fnr family transcriptional regulator [Weissella koreensis]AVH74490.1 Crp/Fnr family transcriptional regulator [Weissella koreensis]AVH74500.1 Crp/Fnr family transcriptional regulator [Weissella koreensis]QGN21030.1 cyclic nucleotide-binding domain-containing protein [Weissella koreensis]